MAKKLAYTTNTPSAATDYVAADGTFKPFTGGGGASWGSITGTLSAQTDLSTALGAKQDTITGAASTIVTSNLTVSRVVVTDGAGKVAASGITSTELGYVSGATANLQSQIGLKQDTLSLTTSGTSGAATLIGSTINIPQYAGAGSGSSFVLISMSATGMAASTTRYYWNAGSGGTTAESQLRTLFPDPCTCSRMYIRTTGTQSATGSLVITLFKNGVATALLVTIAAGSVAGTYSNTANAASFAAGDGYAVEVKNNATAIAAPISGISFKLVI